MTPVGFVYDDVFLAHETPPGHPESPGRLNAIRAALRDSPCGGGLFDVSPAEAAAADIERVHTPAYYRRVTSFGPGYLDPDTYVSARSCEAARFAVGAVTAAVAACREGRGDRFFCAVRPPGHHAEADRGMGFCLFNNVAAGARYAQAAGYPRIMIVDFDVHHGNGTERIFYEDDSVFYFSTHEYPHYPGTGRAGDRGRGAGEGATCNIPLPPGSGDDAVREAYGSRLPAVVSDFSPDLVLVSAGYDLHRDDPLADLMVTDDGVRAIVRGILDSIVGVPAVFALEGGYNLTSLSQSVLITIEEMQRPAS